MGISSIITFLSPSLVNYRGEAPPAPPLATALREDCITSLHSTTLLLDSFRILFL